MSWSNSVKFILMGPPSTHRHPFKKKKKVLMQRENGDLKVRMETEIGGMQPQALEATGGHHLRPPEASKRQRHRGFPGL